MSTSAHSHDYNYFIDTHCHLHDREFFSATQADAMLDRAHQKGVEKIICIGTDYKDSLTARDFALSHENVYWTYGVHPEYAKAIDKMPTVALPLFLEANSPMKPGDWSAPLLSEGIRSHDESGRSPSKRDASISFRGDAPESERSEEEERVSPATAGADDAPRGKNVKRSNKPVAIGEIGLDYHYDSSDRSAQIRLFEQMLGLAHDLDLPVSLHIREAFDDAIGVLDNFPTTRGVVHSFTGSKKDLKKLLARDFYIGVNGLATYTTPALPPLEKIVLETDAPFLTPVPFRGTINEPSYVSEVAAYLSGELGVDLAKITEQTTQNARKIFQI